MKELTKEELEQTDKQAYIKYLILAVIFIVEGIILPIINLNGTKIVIGDIIKTIYIMNIVTYIIKQLFFSKEDMEEFAQFLILILLSWYVALVFINLCMDIFTNLGMGIFTHIDGLEQACELTIIMIPSIMANIVTLPILYKVDEKQKKLRRKCKELGLTGYKQKAYQLRKTTGYFLGLSLILTIIITIIAVISKLDLTAINWEKPIVYLGTSYCAVILGILLRRN